MRVINWKPELIVQLFWWSVVNQSTIPYRYTFNAANLVSRLLIADELHTWNKAFHDGFTLGIPWRERNTMFCFRSVHKGPWSAAEYFAYFAYFYCVSLKTASEFKPSEVLRLSWDKFSIET